MKQAPLLLLVVSSLACGGDTTTSDTNASGPGLERDDNGYNGCDGTPDSCTTWTYE